MPLALALNRLILAMDSGPGELRAPLRLSARELASNAAALRNSAAVVKFTNALLYRGPAQPLTRGDLWFQHGRIIDPASRFWEAASASRFACDVEVDLGGLIVSPGFLDIQFNGAFGVDFSDPALTPEQIAYVLKRLPESGVTGTCPTIVSSDASTYSTVLRTVSRFWLNRAVGAKG